MTTHRMPLRRLLPTALVLLAVSLTAIAFVHDWIVRNGWIEQFTLRRAVALGHLFAPGLERSLIAGDEPAVVAEFSRLVAVPALLHAVVLDEQDRVVVASDPALRGRRLADTPLREAAGIAATVRRTQQQETALTSDHGAVHTAFPLAMALRPGELRPSRTGVFLTATDLAGLRKVERTGIYVRTAIMGAAALLSCLGVWWYFERTFTRRFTELVTAIGSPTAQRGPSVVPEDGADELALIGGQVNRLAAALTANSAALQESEARFRLMADSAPVFIWLADAQGRCIHVNRALLTFTGRTLEQETGGGRGWWERVHPEDQATLTEVLQRSLTARAPFEAEFRLLRHDGEFRWISDHATPRFGAEGEFLGYVGSGIDITTRRRMEEEVQRHSARQAVLLEISDAIVGSEADRARLGREIFGRVGPLLQADAGLNYAVRGDGLEWVAGHGVPTAGAVGADEFAAGDGESLRVATSRQPVNADITQLQEDPAAALRRVGLHAFMCHPLLARDGRVLGTLAFGRRSRVRFSAAEFEFLRTLCHFVSLAWEKFEAEQALRASESRFRELAENIAEVFWVTSPDKSHVLYISPAFERVWGISCAQVRANPAAWIEAIHSADRDRVRRAAMVEQVEGSYCQEYRIVRPDGTQRWIRDRAFPVTDRSGAVVRVVGVAEDITRDVEAKEERARLAAFPESNPNPVFELGPDARIRYGNAAAQQLAAELGEAAPEAILPLHTPAIVAECIATRESRRAIERNYGERIFSWSFYPVADARTIHCYGGEITERRQLEEQVRQTQKMEAIGQLAGGIAHDFNNILAAFMLQLGAARHVPDVPAEIVETLLELDKGARRAASLTRQLLVFGRREVMRFHVLDLAELLENLTKMLRRLVGEHIALALQVDDPGLWIDADSGMIEQVVVNLCVNARDAMPRGGKLLVQATAVEIDTAGARRRLEARPGRFVRLCVSDEGIGIAAPTLGRIFEPFFTTKEAGKGTGLGLATVASIVKQHHGWIEVESQVGQGSAFAVFLPLVAGPDGRREGHVAGGKVPSPGGGETVLLVEDEPGVRRVMSQVLRSSGYEVIEACDGPECLRLWRDKRDSIHALVTDMIMPGGLTGLDLAETIRAECAGLPVLIFSGYTPEVVGRLGAETDFAYLSKPCDSDDLLRSLRTALNSTKRGSR